jgi:cyclic pyranopterin phosphate synthase
VPASPLLDLVLGYDCNAACTYCTITAEMRRRALPTEAVAREIERAARAGFRRVSFTGGEPTIREDLPGLVRFARKRGFDEVKLSSNGLRFAHVAYLEHLVAAGVTDFHLSAHAFGDEAYERCTQLPGSAALFRRGLAAVVERGLDPTLDLILKDDTYRTLPAWIEALHAQGVRRFALWLVSLTDQNAPNVEQLRPIESMVPLLTRAFDGARAGGYEVVTLHVPRCFLPGYEDHVRHPGLEPVRVVTPDDVFELRDSRLSGAHKPAACARCAYDAVCPGLRRDYVERHGAPVRPLDGLTARGPRGDGADPPAR